MCQLPPVTLWMEGGMGEDQFLTFRQKSSTQSQITVNVTFASPVMKAPS